MELQKLSIKNFLGDLPRILNENFTKIKDTIERFYADGKLKADSVEATGEIKANSISASTATFKLGNGQTVSINELIDRIEALERAQNNN